MPYGQVLSDLITTSDGVSSAGLYGFKNKIINGSMQIDQRNAGASVTPTNGQFLVDRFFYGATQTSKVTAQQNAASVTPPVGFINYQGITSSSAYSVLTGDVFYIGQVIEGLNCADLAWGTANAATVTLSFWVRSSLTGTFGGSLQNSAANRSYPFSFTINSANTWEKETITIAGDTSGTWLTTNGKGIQLNLGLGSGSTYSGTAGAWAGSNFITATGATSVVGTNGATFYITGVMLEKGSTATSYDYRPYGTELSLCQRYYWRFDGYNGLTAVASGSVYNATTTARVYLKYPITMRSAPTVSIAGSLTSSGGSADNTVSSLATTLAGIDSTLLDFTTAAGTIGQGKVIYITNNASYSVNYIQGSSEL